jgi:plastocyanin
MTRGTRSALIAGLCGALVGVPALASARDDTPKVTAVDAPAPHWDTETVTIPAGGTVAFEYTAAMNVHNVVITGEQDPSCTALPPRKPAIKVSWSASCQFDHPGTYAFVCEWHPTQMTGQVIVEPTPTPSPTYGGTPTPTPPPGATPTPGPGGTSPTPQSTLKGAVSLARFQRGSRVRGAVKVKAAKSRLEVGVWAPKSKLSGGKSRKAVRIGRFVKGSTAAGRVRFSIKVDAPARSALRRARRLAVTVNVALTPPGGHKLSRSLHATLKAG